MNGFKTINLFKANMWRKQDGAASESSSSQGFVVKLWIWSLVMFHVLRVPKVKAFEIKPHLWNNDDLWKKIGHFKHWKSLRSYHVTPILALKSSSQYAYLVGFKWPVFWNLSLIFIIMKIHEKILDTSSTRIVCTTTMLKKSQCGCPTEVSSI